MASSKKTTKATEVTEEILKDGVAENTADATEAAEPETEGVAEANEAEIPKRKTVVMPRYLFTSDPDSEHHEVCYSGRIYQVKYDEPVSVPLAVAEVIENAIAQKKKVKALIKSLNGKAKEIQG